MQEPAVLKGGVYQRVSKLTDTEEQIHQLNLKGYQASNMQTITDYTLIFDLTGKF